MLRTLCLAFALGFCAPTGSAAAQGTAQDYRRAERFLGRSADTLVVGATVAPRWIGESDRFWYRRDSPHAREYWLVDAVKATRTRAFDHARLASGLSDALGRAFVADSMELDDLDFAEAGALKITIRDRVVRCALPEYRCTATDRPQASNARSPDGKWIAFVTDHNLFVRDAVTGAEQQLTTDGTRDYAWATGVINPGQMIAQGTASPRGQVGVSWSPDSKRLLTYRMDVRKAGRLTMTQYAPPGEVRPRSYEYVYPLSIDSVLPRQELVLFTVDGWRRTNLEGAPLDQYYYGAIQPTWTRDGKSITLTTRERGYASQSFLVWDAHTGQRRVAVSEKGDPYFDVYGSSIAVPFRNATELLWASQRTGWNHLYLYDVARGTMVRQLTDGAWVVSGVARVDTVRRVAFITARGREPARDPYLTHLYAVPLGGGQPRLLTPEAAEHSVDFSPSGRYFVDTYSRVDLPPVTVLRRASDGTVLLTIERADISRLLATGWKAPEPFEALAEDGRTTVYGLLWKPTSFDSTRRYPIVETVYTGPHSFFVPKSFSAFRAAQQSIAELGFVSIMFDAPGTGGRSRAFHDVSYKNLGGGISQHPHIIKTVAATRPYMDIARVGIVGHSAGGYDAARAILTFPDFYKVSVSSAGDHDARLDKAVWNEQWMGWPAAEHYAAQSNMRLAGNLKGKLLLMHGDVDDNVPMANTLQLVDALIKADKDFDLLIMPGQNHGSGGTPYFTRRRWDYFVTHLLGVEPRR